MVTALEGLRDILKTRCARVSSDGRSTKIEATNGEVWCELLLRSPHPIPVVAERFVLFDDLAWFLRSYRCPEVPAHAAATKTRRVTAWPTSNPDNSVANAPTRHKPASARRWRMGGNTFIYSACAQRGRDSRLGGPRVRLVEAFGG